ncbi:uncharacterized protein VNE69_02213 [Vairimorpha necatrix]|uniref:Uncharacterized protein n=1 Tax=Vairimorpha necatrix TaxID=6039 RepID=A0AAX4J9W6_9MICR
MIFKINFIVCAQLFFDDYKSDSIHGNIDNNYISIISSQDQFRFRPYDELEKYIHNENTLKKEYPKDINSLTKSTYSSNLCKILHEPSDKCSNSRSIKDEMKSHSFKTECAKKINIETSKSASNIILKETHATKQKKHKIENCLSSFPSHCHDQLCDFNSVRKQFSECEFQISCFIRKIKRISISKNNASTKSEKYNQVEHAKEYYRKICIIKNEHTKYINHRQFPRIKNLLDSSWVPREIRDIIFEYITLFEHFLSVYDLKKKITGKNLTNTHRIEVHNYNVEIFSCFKDIPMAKILQNLRNQLKCYQYKEITTHNKVNMILIQLKNILTKLYSKSKKVIKYYESLNEIFKE